MKHAGPEALQTIEPLLRELRTLPFLVERKTGTFSRGSRAFLHFHEDPTGMHADVRLGDDFTRYRVETTREQTKFLALVRQL
jgi:hypothetical protein